MSNKCGIFCNCVDCGIYFDKEDMIKHIELTGELQKVALKIAHDVHTEGGRAHYVGGCVRDVLLGMTPKDVDIEVFGLEPEHLEEILKKEHEIIKVGKAFGVYKLKGHEVDITLPRKESKTGKGHKGFKIEGDPHLSFKEAAERRDFTINAIAYDPLLEEFIDPYGGMEDLEKKCLTHVSKKFAEDPLRVLRAMQFVARFELRVNSETVELCKTIEPEGLSKERIFDEWKKLLLKGKKPSLGLNFLKECGWIKYYPELEALIGCVQDAQWHPEGDAWVHTLLCLDAFARERTGDDWEDLIVGFGVLCHDLGKPVTSFKDEEGRIRSPRHDMEGVPIAKAFLERMTEHKDLIEAVLVLVETHMRPVEIMKAEAGDSAVRRLVNKVGRIDRLIRVVSADLGGVPPFDKSGFEEGLKWFDEKLEALHIKDSAPKPFVQGRHLIERGYEPGTHFKKILDDCFEAQLDGAFEDLEGGLKFLDEYLKKNNPNT